jgi:hypothetical protein
MKTKLLTLTALAALSINAAFANSLSVGYGSDFFSRGELLAKDSVQLSVDYTHTNSLGGELVIDVQSAHNTRTYEGITLIHGLAQGEINEMFSVFGGVRHLDNFTESQATDFVFGGQLNTLLDPRVTLGQNLSRNANSLDLELSHDLTFKGFDILLSGVIGDSDLRQQDNVAYYSIGATASKEIVKGLTLSLSADQVDSDIIDRECIVAAALSVNF